MNSMHKVMAGAGLAVVLAAASLPATAQEMELNMATPWPGGHWLEVGAKKFAENVETLTEGRIKINVLPAGALGNALKVTETVQTGVAEVGHNWPAYDWSIDKTGVIFGGWSGGLNPEELMMWLYNDGGAELWQEWRREKFGVEIVPCGVLETEFFMHSHKPVRTAEDLQGLKLRTSGAWAEIAAKLGASTVILPGSEVFSALERGVVDAIEWGGPGLNLEQGFQKIAPYIVAPGLHQASGGHECMFNADIWEQISEQDRELIFRAGKLTMMETYLAYAKDDIAAYDQISSEAEMIRVDDSLVEKVKEVSAEWADEQASGNEWFARAYESQKEFQESVSDWGEYRFPIGR